jgi:hypothetical protein
MGGWEAELFKFTLDNLEKKFLMNRFYQCKWETRLLTTRSAAVAAVTAGPSGDCPRPTAVLRPVWDNRDSS